jgi:hypothetical protein
MPQAAHSPATIPPLPPQALPLFTLSTGLRLLLSHSGPFVTAAAAIEDEALFNFSQDDRFEFHAAETWGITASFLYNHSTSISADWRTFGAYHRILLVR